MENIEQPTTETSGAQLGSEEGSMLGKFKDATSLLNAYMSLQAEFTRKSQKLKELEKMVDTDLLSQKDSALQSKSTTDVEQAASENNNCNPLNFETDLNNALLEYAKQNPSAVDYAEDMKQEILNKQELLSMGGGMDIAFRLATEKHKSLPADIINNPQFIQEYILSNSAVTGVVIDEYIKSLAQKTVTPKIMSGQSKAVVFPPNENVPQTLADANKIFSKMLEK